MNWTHRRPFRHEINSGGNINKYPINRPRTFGEHLYLSNPISDQPIDAIRLQLADYDSSYRPCPVHHPHRIHPYITTFSDHHSSIQPSTSSLRSVSTFETDFVHQRVSTLQTYPSQSSLDERQAIIDEDNNNIQQNQINYNENQNNNQSKNILNISQENNQNQQQQQFIQINQCRTCTMLIDILDQQTQQIRQYTEQISQQADLIAKLARRFAGFEEGIEDQKSQNTSQQQLINQPIIT